MTLTEYDNFQKKKRQENKELKNQIYYLDTKTFGDNVGQYKIYLDIKRIINNMTNLIFVSW